MNIEKKKVKEASLRYIKIGRKSGRERERERVRNKDPRHHYCTKKEHLTYTKTTTHAKESCTINRKISIKYRHTLKTHL